MTNNIPQVLNPSPKARFMQSGDNVSKHRKMVDSGEFQRAVDAGFLQFASFHASSITDSQSAMAAGFRIQGAFDVLQTIRMLSESPNVAKPLPSENLNHNV